MFNKLLLNSKATALERARMNERAMLKSINMEDTYRNVDLHKYEGFGLIPGFCNTNTAESRVKAVETNYLNLGQAALNASREGKIKTSDVLYTEITNIGPEIQQFINNWGWGSIMNAPCDAITEADKYLSIIKGLTDKLAKTGAKTPTPYVPPKEWSFGSKVLVAGALFGAGYLTYLFFVKR